MPEKGIGLERGHDTSMNFQIDLICFHGSPFQLNTHETFLIFLAILSPVFWGILSVGKRALLAAMPVERSIRTPGFSSNSIFSKTSSDCFVKLESRNINREGSYVLPELPLPKRRQI